jgi:hypothetical protein
VGCRGLLGDPGDLDGALSRFRFSPPPVGRRDEEDEEEEEEEPPRRTEGEEEGEEWKTVPWVFHGFP